MTTSSKGVTMRMVCWGSRGSVPVSGKQYLRFGGDTTCLELRTSADEIIIIDAGSGIRRLGNELHRCGRFRYSLILTHAHWDHLFGFPYFKPIYSANTEIAVYGCDFAADSIRSIISKTMLPPHFPVNFDEIKAHLTFHNICDAPFEVSGVQITPVRLSHPNQGLGFRFSEDGRQIVLLTDNELGYAHPGGANYEDYVGIAADADLLIHDAEFTRREYPARRTWGHSTYEEALQLAVDAGVRHLALTHHNADRSDQALDEIVADCRDQIRDRGVTCSCTAIGTDDAFSY